jgi:FlaA1/EpsC-like NDP-sugar epimerase
MSMLTDKRILITGGTGTLGKILIQRLLNMEVDKPKKIILFSRDEEKQNAMRPEYKDVDFRVGDIRNFHSVCSVLRDVDIVINAAALKVVPTCEYYPYEAMLTNVIGPENIIRAIREHCMPVETVIGVSTDKACKPINVYGMTKAIQERMFVQANMDCPYTRFISARYGNVLNSRGSVIPLFKEQIRKGGPVTITTPEMTRFLFTVNQAVDVVLDALEEAQRGDIYIPRLPSARIVDVAKALIGKRIMRIVYTGIRPGEKLHELLVSEEERYRTIERGKYYVILPILPELRKVDVTPLETEYSSADRLMSVSELEDMLRQDGLLE